MRPFVIINGRGGSPFQFTHPVRGATMVGKTKSTIRQFQFTHPVRGATGAAANAAGVSIVSIHAPRAGCDAAQHDNTTESRCFNSRTPCGVRHLPAYLQHVTEYVSIHAPRAGCDTRQSKNKIPTRSFNSRTPCGVRQWDRMNYMQDKMFQFTHPVRGATVYC